jgi:hypothetical protein
LLGSFQIDDQLKLGWLFDWQVGGLSAFENLIYVGGNAPV